MPEQSNRTPSAAEFRAAWIEAARLRTLPLAASGSFIAAGVAAAHHAFRLEVFALMFLVSILLQVIANFADDYGDLAHGLDDETRVGPKRGMQRGIITQTQMKRALVVMCAVVFILGCLLVYVSFTGGPALGASSAAVMTGFIVLGIAAIAAAVLYTVGPHPYGYLGLGDVMSFIFFGLVAVIAGSFLYLHEPSLASLLGGLALGLPVAAVMNINNMRDSTADAAKGKRTIANRLYKAGQRKGRELVAGKSPEERAAIAAVLHYGPRVDGKRFDAQLKAGGAGAAAHVADPETAASLMGEQYMRAYHKVLITVACALSLLFILAVSREVDGFMPLYLAGAVPVMLSYLPLTKAMNGVCKQLDHTKLDRFMAPTSMGTVLVSLVTSIVLALLSLL